MKGTEAMVICVACDRECPPNLRWCSNACFYAEDGYPDDDHDDINEFEASEAADYEEDEDDGE